MRALAAEAGLLHPAERRSRVGDDAPVDADHAGLERLRHPQRPAQVTRVHVGNQAVLGAVCQRDRLGRVGEPDDRRDRPEDLLATGCQRRRARCRARSARSSSRPGPGRCPPVSTSAPSPVAESTSAATLSLVSALTSGPRSTPSSRPGPTRSAPSLAASLAENSSATALVHVEAVGRGAGLAAVAHLGQERAVHGRVDVSILEDQERRVAAQLHRAVDDVVGRLLEQHPADLGRAGERQLAHPRVGQHGLRQRARLARSAGRSRRRRARPPRPACSATASAVSGVSLAGLSTTVQPAASAGPILRVAIAAGKFHGVIRKLTPTGWRVHHDPVSAGRRDRQRAVEPDRLLGVPAEELGRVEDLAARVAQRLAVLQHHQPGQLLGSLRHQLVGAAQALTALPRRRGGPARQGRGGGADRVQAHPRGWRRPPRRSGPRSPGRSPAGVPARPDDHWPPISRPVGPRCR